MLDPRLSTDRPLAPAVGDPAATRRELTILAKAVPLSSSTQTG